MRNSRGAAADYSTVRGVYDHGDARFALRRQGKEGICHGGPAGASGILQGRRHRLQRAEEGHDRGQGRDQQPRDQPPHAAAGAKRRAHPPDPRGIRYPDAGQKGDHRSAGGDRQKRCGGFAVQTAGACRRGGDEQNRAGILLQGRRAGRSDGQPVPHRGDGLGHRRGDGNDQHVCPAGERHSARISQRHEHRSH